MLGRIEEHEQRRLDNLKASFKVIRFEECNSLSEGDNELKNITIRKDGRYMAHFQKEGKRGYVYAKTKTEIIKKLKNLKNNIKNYEPPFFFEEQVKILEAIKGTNIECYIYLFLLTGIRKNELDNNIEKNLNLETNQLKAINEKQRSNKIEYKYIDLSPNYAKLLYSQKDKFVLTTNQVYNEFKKILNNLNIEGHLHKLRHTFATNYYNLGVPLKTIQLWCGHNTPDVTDKVYIGATRKSVKNNLLKLYNELLYNYED